MNQLKTIALQHKNKLSFKLTKYLVAKLFFSALLKQGNKTRAYLKLSKINHYLKKLNNYQSPQHLLYLAVMALKPPLELQTKKVAAQKVKVPSYLSQFRAYTYSVRWLREAAESGDTTSFEENMAKEILAAINLRGKAYKKKQDMCKEITDSIVNLRYKKK